MFIDLCRYKCATVWELYWRYQTLELWNVQGLSRQLRPANLFLSSGDMGPSRSPLGQGRRTTEKITPESHELSGTDCSRVGRLPRDSGNLSANTHRLSREEFGEWETSVVDKMSPVAACCEKVAGAAFYMGASRKTMMALP